MRAINHETLKKILKVAYKTKRAYFIWGATGIGKSYTIKQLAKELAKEEKREYVEWNNLSREEKLKVIENNKKYFVLVDQRALQFDLGDFKLPKFDNDNGTFEWTIPLVYKLLCKKDTKGILFFDEFNLAPPSIQGMFYQIINDRQIGEHRISDGVFVVGAGNRLEDKANVYEMSAPLLDRFEHIELGVPSLEEWTKWAIKNDIDSRILAFLHFKPSYLFKYDPNSSDKSFCLSPDTEIIMADGNKKKIKDIKVGEEVLGFKDGKFLKAKVLNKFKKKVNEIYKVKTKSGNEIKCSGDHKFLTQNGYVKAKNLNRQTPIYIVWEKFGKKKK